jgi:tyrosine-protein kinase Etk/Wzc
MNKELNVFKYISILLQWKRFIIINFIAVFLLAVTISFLLPKWYKSTASLLPPKQPDIFNSLGSASSMLKGLGSLGKLSGLGQKPSNYNYFAILKSRTTMEKIIKKFDLINVYDISDSSMEKAIKELEANVAFEEQNEDNITIEVYDKDSVRAADMANYFVEVLNEVSTRLGTQEARSNRDFIESRLDKVKIALASAEDSLRIYQEKSGMIISPEETATVSSIATLYGLKAKKEIELSVLGRSLGTDNESYQQTKIELNELNRKLITFPNIGLKSLRLYRDVAIQQKILEFLIPIYEQAKIEEQKDVPVLLVLDKAVPAERKSKPQRVLIIFLTSGLALFFFVLLTFLFHGIIHRTAELNSLEGKLGKYVQWIAAKYKIDKK